MRLTLAPALLCFALAPLAQAEELSPEKVAEVKHAEKKAEAEIDAKHGNKKSKDLSPAEKQQIDAEKMKARTEVLKKQGVQDKDYDRSQLRQNKADRASTDAKMKDLDKKDADAAAAAKAKADAEKEKPAGEIQIQRGFNEQHPVELENKGDQPQVEKGVPEDVQRDIDEAKLQGSGGEGASKDAAKAPAKATGKGGKTK